MKVTLHMFANPDDLKAIILTLKDNPGLKREEIVKKAEDLGYVIHDKKRLEALTLARNLNLIEKRRNSLTTKGSLVYELINKNYTLFPEIIHGLQVTLWNPNNKKNTAFSWSYREVCRILWNFGALNNVNNSEIASEIINQAIEVFGTNIAFSNKSVLGILHWLERLHPPILTKKNKSYSFKRRNFCPPELFVLVVDYLYRNRDYGSNLLLTENVQEEICWMSLIEVSGFDRVLEYATRQFEYLEAGIGGWGRYLTLHRKPTLEDFV